MQCFLKKEDKSPIDVANVETTCFDNCAVFGLLFSTVLCHPSKSCFCRIMCNLLHLPLWCVHCFTLLCYPSQHRYDFWAQIEMCVVAAWLEVIAPFSAVTM